MFKSSINNKSHWAIVRNGAVAEFSITDTDKPEQSYDHHRNILTVRTNKAILQLELNEKIIPVVAENANYRCSPWSQNIYLCIPKKDSNIPSNKRLTHVGNWDKFNIRGELWDLGIGYNDFQANIIVKDNALYGYLKQKEGNYIIDDSEF
ncbi:MAG: hypothetical protein L0H53_09335 [Candidatus Nitrosocosmicus sp.]|nr:hypothetical protein [Candidatus Nitrosocosmicus sp.]MDN5868631.1 hypothetical protein [Candidatus Nitrosocosmicus sp.]